MKNFMFFFTVFFMFSCGSVEETLKIISDSQKLDEDKSALTFANIAGSNTSNSFITSNLTLPATGVNGSTITWSSSDTFILSNSGVVNRDNGLHNVILTATLTLNLLIKTKTFNLTVVKLSQKIPLLVIKVNFQDTLDIQSSDTTWSNKFFATTTGTVNDYFNAISYGKFQFTKVSESNGVSDDGVITVSLNQNHPLIDFNYDTSLANIVTEALTKANSSINFAIYDTNNNGIMEASELQIFFIAAGLEGSISAPNISKVVWGHSSCLLSGIVLDAVNLAACDLVDGNNNITQRRGRYTMIGEKHRSNQDASIGIIAHELAHSIWFLPDLYDTDSSNGVSAGIGAFGLMAVGSWGQKDALSQEGSSPVHMSAYSKIASGFITPTVLNSTRFNNTIKDTNDVNYNTFKIEISEKEYFLLENRSVNGYDAGLYVLDDIPSNGSFGGGISIWHIDENMANDNNTDNADENHKLVDLEEADGIKYLDFSSDNYGKSINLFYGEGVDTFNEITTPNTNDYNNANSGIEIRNISVKSSSMSFDLEID